MKSGSRGTEIRIRMGTEIPNPPKIHRSRENTHQWWRRPKYDSPCIQLVQNGKKSAQVMRIQSQRMEVQYDNWDESIFEGFKSV